MTDPCTVYSANIYDEEQSNRPGHARSSEIFLSLHPWQRPSLPFVTLPQHASSTHTHTERERERERERECSAVTNYITASMQTLQASQYHTQQLQRQESTLHLTVVEHGRLSAYRQQMQCTEILGGIFRHQKVSVAFPSRNGGVSSLVSKMRENPIRLTGTAQNPAGEHLKRHWLGEVG